MNFKYNCDRILQSEQLKHTPKQPDIVYNTNGGCGTKLNSTKHLCIVCHASFSEGVDVNYLQTKIRKDVRLIVEHLKYQKNFVSLNILFREMY